MGIVRRCGRPPRPAPLIQKSTRDRVVVRLAPIATAAEGAIDPPRATSRELEAAATARIAAIAFAGGGAADRGDRRPRIPAIPVIPADRRGDAARDHRACDEVICSCRDHAIVTAE